MAGRRVLGLRGRRRTQRWVDGRRPKEDGSHGGSPVRVSFPFVISSRRSRSSTQGGTRVVRRTHRDQPEPEKRRRRTVTVWIGGTIDSESGRGGREGVCEQWSEGKGSEKNQERCLSITADFLRCGRWTDWESTRPNPSPAPAGQCRREREIDLQPRCCMNMLVPWLLYVGRNPD